MGAWKESVVGGCTDLCLAFPNQDSDLKFMLKRLSKGEIHPTTSQVRYERELHRAVHQHLAHHADTAQELN
jgi:hypothetical protein